MGDIKSLSRKNRLLSLQEELDQILSELLEQPQQERFMTRKRSLDVNIDVYETSEALHIRAELPGCEKEDIALFLSRDLLVIEGKKRIPYSGEKLHFLNLEREFGKFKREIGIPKPIYGQEISAVMNDGVLFVTMPKISDRRGKRKRIPVE